MITNAILLLFFSLTWALTLPLRLFNDVTLPDGVSDFINNLNYYLEIGDRFIDVTTLLIVLGLIITFETSIFTLKLINWIIKKIPMVN